MKKLREVEYWNMTLEQFAHVARAEITYSDRFPASEQVRMWQKLSKKKTWYLYVDKESLQPIKSTIAWKKPGSYVTFRSDIDAHFAKLNAWEYITKQATALQLIGPAANVYQAGPPATVTETAPAISAQLAAKRRLVSLTINL